MATIPSPALRLPMPSTMSDQPLAIRYIFEHAMSAHPRKHIISRDGNAIVRLTYGL